MLNLATLLERAALVNPDGAIIGSGRRSTLAETNRAAAAVAAGLVQSGIRPGDRVALAFRNGLSFVVAYFAVLRTGAIAVLLNQQGSLEEMTWQLRDSRATALLSDGDSQFAAFPGESSARAAGCHHWSVTGSELVTHPALTARHRRSELPQPMVDLPPDDPAVMMYTSGTTGTAKAAVLSHSSLIENAASFGEALGLSNQDTVLIALPLFHSLALTGQLHPALVANARIVLLPRTDPSDVLAALVDHAVTLVGGVPTVYWDLVHGGTPDSIAAVRRQGRLRGALCAGAPVSSDLKRIFEERFGTEMVVGYGLTEVSGVAVCRAGGGWSPGCVGEPIAGVEIQIVLADGADAGVNETGEILIGGHGLMTEYFGRPVETATSLQGGRFHTGDLGRRDPDGQLYLIGRLKDIIIRAGNKVAPAEVEEILERHPDVLRACVVGIPDDRVGEEVVAFIVLRRGATLDPDALVEWARDRLSPHAYPRMVHVRGTMPTGATGKVLRETLRSELLRVRGSA